MPEQEIQVPSHPAGLSLLNYLQLHDNHTRERKSNNAHQHLFPYLLEGLRSDFHSLILRAVTSRSTKKNEAHLLLVRF